jgi:hypothetical protein
MTFGDDFAQLALRSSVFLRKYADPKADRIRSNVLFAGQGWNPEPGLASFRSHPGLETEPLASFRSHGAKVSNQPGARDPEQASRLTLVATRALINRSDVAPHCIGQRKLITVGRGRDG